MKILIVEDDEKLAQMLKIAFKINDLSVDYCTDGKEGDKKIQNHGDDYDLVILDIMLPGLGGLEIAENIKKKKIKVPVFILSARNNKEDINRAVKLGVKDYFVKPFSFSDLLEKVKLVASK